MVLNALERVSNPLWTETNNGGNRMRKKFNVIAVIALLLLMLVPSVGHAETVEPQYATSITVTETREYRYKTYQQVPSQIYVYRVNGLAVYDGYIPKKVGGR